MKNHYYALSLLLTLSCSLCLNAQTKPRTYARLIWQDSAEQTLKWGDLKKGTDWSLDAQAIPGQPKLDVEHHSFVQMQTIDQIAIIGIRDDDDGAISSGWCALDFGVEKEMHGDHYHWRYSGAPTIIDSKLDTEQGNPAHVYHYGKQIYIANDKKNGFTQLSPNLVGKPDHKPDTFYQAGGGHITLAALPEQVAYATWIDRDGENKGRVDIVGLGSNSGRSYHVHLPTGGIHGATTNSNKAFFAPSDGVCWIEADLGVSQKAEDVDVYHLALGETDEGMPHRTGAFTNIGNYVLFTVGRTSSPYLCLIDAAQAKPSVQKLSIPVAEGNSLSTPTPVRSRTGSRFALLFEEDASGEKEERLHVVSLDPNLDGNFADATLVKSLSVGHSLIEGHSGHHQVIPLSRQHLAISNPGDGTISIISMSTWERQATLKVGGTPTRMAAIGG